MAYRRSIRVAAQVFPGQPSGEAGAPLQVLAAVPVATSALAARAGARSSANSYPSRPRAKGDTDTKRFSGP